MFYSSHSSKRYRAGGSARAGGGVLALAALALAVLGPILAQLFYFAVSRKREYLADASAARLTRYPEGLARALEKIARSDYVPVSANAVTAALYIVNPLKSAGGFSFLTSTHPPLESRIKILRSLTKEVGYAEYQKAYAAATGDNRPVFPASAFADTQTSAVRRATSQPETLDRSQGAGDLLRAVNGFVFLLCSCGLKIKVPPDFTEARITCPRCGFIVENPFFGSIRSSQEGSYVRRTKGWESFLCSCGRVVQVSPLFLGSHLKCAHCGRRTEIIEKVTA